jgi:hypothetical protein
VERLNGVIGGGASAQCNPAAIWIAEVCGFGPGKHTRIFYHPGLKGLVMAGGDRPVGMYHPGYGDGTGSEIVLYEPGLEKWTTLRPFCVPGEPQPGRPDNVVWALDAKRNRAIMAPGFYFITQGGSTGSSGCGAIEGIGAYVFDFATNKFIGPDDPAYLTVPADSGGGRSWGGDNGATYGIVDPVNDEFLQVRYQIGLQRMHLATKAWRTTPLLQTYSFLAQTAIDVQGRALYYVSPMGLPRFLPNGDIDQQPYLVKVLLDDPSGKQEFIKLPWPFRPFGGDAYLAFDPGNRVVFVPNNVNFGGSLVGLGIYHVDTGVWEWEDTPPEVAASLYGFDEHTGVLVGMGKRSQPFATYLYKYGGPIKALPVQPPRPPVQKTASLSESFNRPDKLGLGPEQPWTVIEGAMRTVGNRSEFVPDPTTDSLVWSSARVEKDLPSADMEVWVTNVNLESGGGFMHEVTNCAVARFSATSATYYAVCLGAGEGQHLRLVKVVNGVRTTLGSDVIIGDLTYGAEIRLRVTGSAKVTLTAFYRGKLLHTLTDSAPDRIAQGTRAGLAGQGLTTFRAQMDDWRAGVSAVTP